MVQQLNRWSKLYSIEKSVAKANLLQMLLVSSIKPEAKWSKRDEKKNVNSLTFEYESVAKDRSKLRLGVKG